MGFQNDTFACAGTGRCDRGGIVIINRIAT
jgi:hypothetical protein